MLAVLLSLAACSQPSPAPLRPPGELLFTTDEAGRQLVYEARDGSLAGDLGQGRLSVRLNDGGDVQEAYLSAAEPAGIQRVRPGHPFQLEKIASGPPSGLPDAALAPAPGLTRFVGSRTVLVVRFPDGTMAGLQAGTPLWKLDRVQLAGAAATSMYPAGDLVVVTGAAGIQGLVEPESGRVAQLTGRCSPGVVGELGSLPVRYCQLPEPVLEQVTGGFDPIALAGGLGSTAWVGSGVRRREAVVTWPDGSYLRLAPDGKVLDRGRGPAPLGPPAVVPDESAIWLATVAGISRVTLSSGATRTIERPATSSVALSRDGNFVYALGGGFLDVYDAATSARLAHDPAVGTGIEVVAGG